MSRSPEGQIVIPQQLRAELGIHPGDEVELWRDGDHVALRPVGARRPRRRGATEAEEAVRDLRSVPELLIPEAPWRPVDLRS